MKRVLFLLLSIFLIQCSPNEVEKEEPEEIPKNLTISFNIIGNVLNQNRQKTMYVSNDLGLIEGQIDLVNNQENLLSIPKKPNTKYHLIILDKLIFNGKARNEFSIFENVESSEFTLKENSPSNTNTPKVDLYINNTGGLIEAPIGATGGGYFSWSYRNGGTIEYNGNCLSNPGDFFASFKKTDEPFARYFWTKDIAVDKSFELSYEELPKAPAVETKLPEYQSASFHIYGYRSERPWPPHMLNNGYIQGNLSIISYVPEEDVFDYIYFNAHFYKRNIIFSHLFIGAEIPARIDIPAFDFTINNFSANNTNYTTTGNYDISNATFVVSNDNINTDAVVKVFSEYNRSVSFSIDNLINSLFKDFPSLDGAPLKPVEITLSSFSQYENYGETAKSFIENHYHQSPGIKRETITKRVH